MATADQLLAAALTLPPDERARLAHDLLLSLDTEAEPDTAGAWAEELTRRLEEVRTGAVDLPDLDEVDARLEQNLSTLRK